MALDQSLEELRLTKEALDAEAAARRQAEDRVEKAEDRVEKAEDRAEKAEDRAEKAEDRVEKAEGRAEKAEALNQEMAAEIERLRQAAVRSNDTTADGALDAPTLDERHPGSGRAPALRGCGGSNGQR